MKKIMYLWLCLLCMSQLIIPVHAEKEDISPLPSVTFGQQESTAELGDATKAQELLNQLKNSQHYETKLTIVQTFSQDEFTASTREVLRQNNQWYVRLSAPNSVSSSVFLQTNDDESIEQMVLSLNDMMSYTADVMTQYPEHYEGTAVASFFNVFNEKPDEFVDRYIRSETNNLAYQALYEDTRSFEQFCYALIERWLEQLGQSSTDELLTYTVEEDRTEQLSALIDEIVAQYPTVAPLIEMIDGMFLGTMRFDTEKQEIGIGLITPQGAIEYFIRKSDNTVPQLQESQIMTEAQFHELLGFEFFESSVTAQEPEVTYEEEEGEE